MSVRGAQVGPTPETNFKPTPRLTLMETAKKILGKDQINLILITNYYQQQYPLQNRRELMLIG